MIRIAPKMELYDCTDHNVFNIKLVFNLPSDGDANFFREASIKFKQIVRKLSSESNLLLIAAASYCIFVKEAFLKGCLNLLSNIKLLKMFKRILGLASGDAVLRAKWNLSAMQ